MSDRYVLIFDPYGSRHTEEIITGIASYQGCKYSLINSIPSPADLSALRPHLIFTLFDEKFIVNGNGSQYEDFFSAFPLVPVIGIIDNRQRYDFGTHLHRYIWHLITFPFTAQDIRIQLDWHFSSGEKQATSTINNLLKQMAGNDLLKGNSFPLMEIKAQILNLAPYDVTVLLCGETGTGKELCARMIHFFRYNESRPFIPVNCGALPEDLLENELFGHKKGAYTHAYESETGLVIAAQGGTLFLDEIEALSESSQVKLLRFIEDKQFKPLGQSAYQSSNVRIIAAAKEYLWDYVQEGRFREDLFYRLNVVQIQIPSLRERPDDIPILAQHFVAHYANLYNKDVCGLSPLAIFKLRHYHWPGNVRELENVIQGSVVRCQGKWIMPADLRMYWRGSRTQLPQGSFNTAVNNAKAAAAVRYLSDLLACCKGNISQAARFAQKERSAFCRLLKQYAVDPSKFRK